MSQDLQKELASLQKSATKYEKLYEKEGITPEAQKHYLDSLNYYRSAAAAVRAKLLGEAPSV